MKMVDVVCGKDSDVVALLAAGVEALTPVPPAVSVRRLVVSLLAAGAQLQTSL